MKVNKFKVWNKRRFLNEDEYAICPNGQLLFYDTYRGEWYTAPYLDVKIVQYTGLKDSRGVEIYEGDIMVERVSKYDYIVIEVVYHNGCFMGKEMGHEPEYPIYEFLNGVVIGNIFENPELI